MIDTKLLHGLGALTGGVILSALPVAQSFQQALPAGTIYYSGMPDLRQTMQDAKSSPMLQMWQEEEVQDFASEGLAMLKGMVEEYRQMGKAMYEDGQLPIDPAVLETLEVRSMGVALTSLNLSTFHDQPWPDIGFAMHFDFGPSAKTWRGLIELGTAMLAQQAGTELAMTNSEIEGGEMVTLRAADDEYPMALHMAFVGDGLLIGTKEDEVRGILARMGGSSGQTTTGGFGGAAGMLDSTGAEAATYMQLNPLLDFAMSALRQAQASAPESAEIQMVDLDGVERAVSALGLRSIRGIGSVSRYENGKSITESLTIAPKDGRTGLFAASDAKLDANFLRWVPRDAVSFSAFSFRPMSIYEALVGAVKAYDPEMGDQALAMLDQMEQQVGLRVREDFLGSLGERFYTWTMPSLAMGSTPEMAILAEVRDQDKLVKSLQTIGAMTGGQIEFEEFDRRGVQGWQVRFDLDLPGEAAQAAGMLAAFSPRFTFYKGHMVTAFTISDLKRAMERMDRGMDAEMADDIRSNPEFKPYLSKVEGSSGLSSVSFTDWKTTFETYYQSLVGILPFLPMPQGVPLDLSLLPESRTLTKHLFGGFSWSTVDDTGMRSMSISPFGPETTVPLMIGVAGAAGFGAVMAIQEGGEDFGIEFR
jgi:hypothetical protein